VSFKFQIELAAYLKAILFQFLRFGVLLLRILPSDILLFGANLSQDVKCGAFYNFNIPFSSSSLISVSKVP
jgi:hypothetical protein